MTKVTVTEKCLADAFYKRLISSYGYSPEQMGRDVVIGGSARADIAIWRTAAARIKDSIPDICVVLICKDEHIKIDADRYLAAFKESLIGTVNFFVLHNLKETKVFLLDSSHPMGGVERIGDFPKASDVLTDDVISAFIDRMRGNTKNSLLHAFERCHNIVRNNDKLSPEAAFDEISKVMFIKMMYERKPDGELIYSQDKFLKDERAFAITNRGGDYVAKLFNEVKQNFSDDDLYEEYDYVRICRKSFISILKELEVIDFYDMSEDVKGVAYESLVGKTFRGELGQFFTPRQVVEYMIEVLDIKEGESVCDPCCGSGGFLIRAFEHVQDTIDRDIQDKISVVKSRHVSAAEKRDAIAVLLGECDKHNPESRYGKLCKDYFFGVDANVRMARTAKMNMIMHGDGRVGVYLHDGLLDYKEVREGRFDVVLINPPYGIHVDRSSRDDDGNLIFGHYQISNSAAELMFVERVMNLLKPGGRAGLVLPEGLFTNTNLEMFRKFVDGRAQILNITSMPANVFLASGANVKPNLLFIRKYREGEKRSNDYKICLANALNDNLLGFAPLVRGWVSSGYVDENEFVRTVDKSEMVNWSVATIFSEPTICFNSDYPSVRLDAVVSPSVEKVLIADDKKYTRITVRLGGKGIVLRDVVLGNEIGTKRQIVVHPDQLVISKIDGKSGAIALVPPEFDGAIVTHDFPVFNIDSKQILPEYLLLVLCHPLMLRRLSASVSGSTGRRRLSIPRFLATRIPLPTISEQRRLLCHVLRLRDREAKVRADLHDEIEAFYGKVFI